MQSDHDIRRAVHDVIVGENVAFRADDYARSQALLTLFLLGHVPLLPERGTIVTEELTEEVVRELLVAAGPDHLGGRDIDHGGQNFFDYFRIASMRGWLLGYFDGGWRIIAFSRRRA